MYFSTLLRAFCKSSAAFVLSSMRSCKSFLFNLVGENWAIIPIVTAVLFATAGPFAYLYLQRKTEERLLREDKRVY